MEINRFEDVLGVMPTENIVEGRLVCLCEQSFDYGFGSRTDLVGVKLPTSAEEATRCRFILTWEVTNVSTPIYEPQPTLAQGARREGWNQPANTPITNTKIYLTYPGYTDGQTIPSGTPSLAFSEGTFTIPLGGYVADADIIKPGSQIKVAYGANTKGMPTYASANAVGVIGVTERYDSDTGALTIRID